MFEVQYWQGVIPFNAAKFEEYKPLILRLLSGDTKGADLDLKRSTGHKIYSVKLNDAGRLLFTTVNHKILLLEVLLTHNYAQSHFLKSNVLRAFKEKHSEDLSENIEGIWFDNIAFDELDLKYSQHEESRIHYKAVVRYNKQFVSLTPEQFVALDAPFPMLLSGPPGSGKSLLAIELITKAQNEFVPMEALPIACVCLSAGVRDYLSKQYQQTPKSMSDRQNVIFLTFDELLLHVWAKALNESHKTLSVVGKKHSLDFIRSLQMKEGGLPKRKSQVFSADFLSAEPDLIYQGFALIASLGIESYLAQASQQAIFTSGESTRMVLEAFERYQAHLRETNAIHPELCKPILVGKAHCLHFIEKLQAKRRELSKQIGHAFGERFLHCNADEMYQEFYLIASLTEADYLRKGTRETLFTDKNDRHNVFDAFQQYQALLLDTHVIHPAFYAWPSASPMFRKMIVDEAQDLSLMQLQQLLSVTENYQMACAMDPHQSLMISHSLRVALSQLLNQGRHTLSSIQLTQTHRCPITVARMANKILAIKNHAFEGASEKDALQQIQLEMNDKEGRIEWPDTLPNLTDMRNQVNEIRRKYSLKETEVALVVAEEDVDRIKLETGLTLVFCAQSIKGLEYKCVIVCEPLKGLNALQHHLPSHYDAGALTIKSNRAKKQSSPQKKSAVELSSQHAIGLNKVFVSLTRTSQYLVVWQSTRDRTLSHLIGHIKSVLSPPAEAPSLKVSADDSVPAMVETTLEDWQTQCMNVYYAGNIKQAENIYNNHVKGAKGKSFRAYIEETNAPKLGIKTASLTSPLASQNALSEPSMQQNEKKSLGSEDLKSVCGKSLKKISHKKKTAKEALPSVIGKNLLPNFDTFAKEISAEKAVKEGRVGLDREQTKKIDIFYYVLSAGRVTEQVLARLFETTFYDKVLAHRFVTHNEEGYGNLVMFLMFDCDARNCLINMISKPGNETIKQTLLIALKESLNLAQRTLNVPMFQKQAMALAFFFDALISDGKSVMQCVLDNLYADKAQTLFSSLHDIDCLDFILSQQSTFFLDKGGLNALHFTTKQGSSIFYELCKKVSDKNSLLRRHWELLKPSLSSGRLHSPTLPNNETPFYQLCKHKEGIELIESDFAFFEEMITDEGFHETITGDELNHNRSAFFELMSSNEGLSLLRKHWSFFQTLITHAQLHQPRIIPLAQYRKFIKHEDEAGYEIDGSAPRDFFAAETPFHHCTLTNQGLMLMGHDLDFFLGGSTIKQWHAVMDAPNFQDASTPLEALSARPEGVNFITSHWAQYFEDKVNIEDLKSKPLKALATSVLEEGLCVSEERGKPHGMSSANRLANLMYLAAHVNHYLFFELWQEDSDKAFLTHKMANGKSAFVNLNEQAHFDVVIFNGTYRRQLRDNLEREYNALLKVKENAKESDIVLLLHLASCFDINTDWCEPSDVLAQTDLLSRQLALLEIDWKGKIANYIPVKSKIALHFLSFAVSEIKNHDHCLLSDYWAYFREVLLASYRLARDHFFCALSQTDTGSDLLINDWHFFSELPSLPLSSFLSTVESFERLESKWCLLSDKITEKKLHEVSLNSRLTSFQVLCSTKSGYDFIVSKWSFFQNKVNEEQVRDNPSAYCRDGKSSFHSGYKNNLLKMLVEDECYFIGEEKTASPKKKQKKRKKNKSSATFFSENALDNEAGQKEERVEKEDQPTVNRLGPN